MTAPASRLEHRIADLQPELVAFLRRRAPGAEEEIAQDVWVRVLQAAPNIDDDAGFRAYCFTVARRVLVDGHRRRLARVQLVAVDDLDARAGATPAPDEVLHARAVLATVEAELDAMRPEIAEVFRERTSGTSSFKDIAARQGVPLNTALGRMHRATKRIAEALRARDLIGADHDR